MSSNSIANKIENIYFPLSLECKDIPIEFSNKVLLNVLIDCER